MWKDSPRDLRTKGESIRQSQFLAVMGTLFYPLFRLLGPDGNGLCKCTASMPKGEGENVAACRDRHILVAADHVAHWRSMHCLTRVEMP